MSFIKIKRWVFLLVGAITLLLLITIWTIPLPSPLFSSTFSPVLLDEDGQLLNAKVAVDEQWRFPKPEFVPDELISAVTLYEDEFFHTHPGVNPFSLYRAWRQNQRAGKIISGGSTITMQVVRLALGNPPRTYWQKLKEILLAIKLEVSYSKSEILKKYLTHAPYGGNVVGVRAASYKYFNRSIQQLSKAEMALLAILPNNPGYLFPGSPNEDQLLAKRDQLIRKWAKKEEWPTIDLELTIAESLPQQLVIFPTLGHHALYHPENAGNPTHLNLAFQEKVEKTLQNHLNTLKNNLIYNACALVVDIESGGVRAYAGNGNPLEKGQNRFVDIIQSKRSPGSTLKPVLYALALSQRILLPQELLPDHPLHLPGFEPKNFNRLYSGAIPADEALASSLNIPFVHLLQSYGYQQFHSDLVDTGINLPQSPEHYGLALILGGIEVSPWELTALYRQMAFNHLYLSQAPAHKTYCEFSDQSISLSQKSLDHKWKAQGWFDPNSVSFMIEAMKQLRRPDQVEHWDRFGSASSLAWKTGTSFGFRDAWALGIGGRHIICVWVGNADGVGRPGLIGGKMAAPILFDIAREISEPSYPELPSGSSLFICAQTGKKAGPLCPKVKEKAIPYKWHDQLVCTYHRIEHYSADKKFKVASNCYDKTMVNDTVLHLPPLMARYRPNSWLHKKQIPWSHDCRHLKESREMTLVYPTPGAAISLVADQSNQNGKVVFEAVHEDTESKIFWYVDNEYRGQTIAQHKIAMDFTPGTYQLTITDHFGQSIHRPFHIVPVKGASSVE